MTKADLKDKKIGILGLGVNNARLLEWLIKHSEAAEVTICDCNRHLKFQNPNSKFQINSKIQIPKLKKRLGEDYLKNLTDFEIIFRTPGIPYLTPEIQAAKKAGVIISSQTKLFFDLCPAKIVGVTGTKGKGTTAALIYEILKQNVKRQMSNVKVYFAGNIGKDPFEFLDELTTDDVVVMELSSFQLQDLEKSPTAAVITNITSDHLNHHHSIKEYIDAKTNIIHWQQKNDWAILNADDAVVSNLAPKIVSRVAWFSVKKPVVSGAYWQDDKLILSDIEEIKKPTVIIRQEDFLLPGEHNLANAAAATAATAAISCQLSAIRSGLRRFRGLPHRLQLIAVKDGIYFYDDSISTVPGATMAAITTFKNRPVHLIVGGSSKGADFTELGRVIDRSSVKTLVLLGNQESKKIAAGVNNPQIKKLGPLMSMNEIAKTLIAYTKPGDVVLLSPAAASFDLFKNYRQRSQKFKQAVNDHF